MQNPRTGTDATLSRYGPLLSLVLVIVAAAVSLPSDNEIGQSPTIDSVAAPDATGTTPADSARATGAGSAPTTPSQAAPTSAPGADATAGQPAQSAGTGTTTSTAPSAPAPPSSATEPAVPRDSSDSPATAAPDDPAAVPAPLVADPKCDTDRGLLMIPSMFAPACSNHDGPDTGETILIIAYYPPRSAEGSAAARDAGIDPDELPTEEEAKTRYREYFELLESHIETYGRDIQLEFFEGSGDTYDDEIARRDALAIAETGAFAAFPAGLNAGPNLIRELANQGVMWFGQEPLPGYFYEETAPYAWSIQASIDATATIFGEYVGKRLSGRPAKWAGDPLLQTQQRKFGLVVLEARGESSDPAIENFRSQLAQWGDASALVTTIKFFEGDINGLQEQARTAIAKMKDEGVTTVLYMAGTVQAIPLTQEATNQEYFPEWSLIGINASDHNVIARLYDQQQWAHAFGIAGFTTPTVPEDQLESEIIFRWHYGRDSESGPIGLGHHEKLITIFRAIHLAGPELNAFTVRDALWNAPVTGGTIITPAFDYGPAGRYSFADYGGVDDVAEIWWDPSAVVEDGLGAYRYIDGGRRFISGEQPTSEPNAFVAEGTITEYSERPEPDRLPDYPCVMQSGDPCPSGA